VLPCLSDSLILTGTNALYAFDVASGQYANGGAPILTPQPGYQFRGVAMAPVRAQ
jgi:hypothetical protein